MAAADWLALVARETGARIVLAGPAGGRPASYCFHQEPLGDILDDLSDFYGWSWRQVGDAIVIETSRSYAGMPPKLALWVDKRSRAREAPPTFQELLRLSAYPEEALEEVTRYLRPILEGVDWRPYRLLSALSPEQLALTTSVGLKVADLTDAQHKLLEESLAAVGSNYGFLEQSSLWLATDAESTNPPAGGMTSVKLQLRYSEESIQSSVDLLSCTFDSKDPVFAEMPPSPKDETPEGSCEIKTSPIGLDIEVRSANLRTVLDKLSGATGKELKADWSIQETPFCIFTKGIAMPAVLDALAAAVDGAWQDTADGGKLLMPNPRKPPRSEPEESVGDRLRRLFWWASRDRAEQLMVAACDLSLYAQIDEKAFHRWAIQLLEMLDPYAPEKAGKPGELLLDGSRLPGPALDLLLKLGKRLVWPENEQPVYDSAILRDPQTEIRFVWDGQGRYDLTVKSPRFADLPLESSFEAVGRGGKPWILSRFPDQPWFMRLPSKVPQEYLAYLDRTRAWRGRLALKHIAPLAFLPETQWGDLQKAVPEFEVVTRSNRRAIQYYACLDHACRQELQSVGRNLNAVEWAEDRLLRAVQVAAGLKPGLWTKDDAAFLRTHNGVADSIQFRIAGSTLTFEIPKADSLLGEEGCLPATKVAAGR